ARVAHGERDASATTPRPSEAPSVALMALKGMKRGRKTRSAGSPSMRPKRKLTRRLVVTLKTRGEARANQGEGTPHERIARATPAAPVAARAYCATLNAALYAALRWTTWLARELAATPRTTCAGGNARTPRKSAISSRLTLVLSARQWNTNPCFWRRKKR